MDDSVQWAGLAFIAIFAVTLAVGFPAADDACKRATKPGERTTISGVLFLFVLIIFIVSLFVKL